MVMNSFRELFHSFAGTEFASAEPLKADSSDRKIFRLRSEGQSVVGIFNEHAGENEAYINFTNAFLKKSLRVPKVLAHSDDMLCYIVEDLGDVTLFSLRKREEKKDNFLLYSGAVSDLAGFQVRGKSLIESGLLKSVPSFDSAVITSDLLKFSRYYLEEIRNFRLSKNAIAEAAGAFLDIVNDSFPDYFMYRDFQTRNIMLKDGQLFYIDFQSGMKGPPVYDLVSFLFSGSISLDDDEREFLSECYFRQFEEECGIPQGALKRNIPEIALLRLIQALGSYGYVYSKRREKSILGKVPLALSNIGRLEEKLKASALRDFVRSLPLSQ